MTKIKSNVGSILLLQYQMFSMHLFLTLSFPNSCISSSFVVVMPNILQIVGELLGFFFFSLPTWQLFWAIMMTLLHVRLALLIQQGGLWVVWMYRVSSFFSFLWEGSKTSTSRWFSEGGVEVVKALQESSPLFTDMYHKSLFEELKF